jgi:hypothetical protein
MGLPGRDCWLLEETSCAPRRRGTFVEGWRRKDRAYLKRDWLRVEELGAQEK